MNFQSLLWQKHDGHFLEPHTAQFQIVSSVTLSPEKAIKKSQRDGFSKLWCWTAKVYKSLHSYNVFHVQCFVLPTTEFLLHKFYSFYIYLRKFIETEWKFCTCWKRTLAVKPYFDWAIGRTRCENEVCKIILVQIFRLELYIFQNCNIPNTHHCPHAN